MAMGLVMAGTGLMFGCEVLPLSNSCSDSANKGLEAAVAVVVMAIVACGSPHRLGFIGLCLLTNPCPGVMNLQRLLALNQSRDKEETEGASRKPLMHVGSLCGASCAVEVHACTHP